MGGIFGSNIAFSCGTFCREVMPVKRILIVATLIAVSLSGTVEAKIWYVPSDAPSLQAAIDSCAASGDAIMAMAGVYHEGSIVVDGKSISIDQAGGQVTVIAPAVGGEKFLTFRNGSGGLLRSFIIRGFGTAVVIENASPSVQTVSIKACNQGLSVSGSSSPQFIYSIVDSCATAITVQGGTVTLQNETIVFCQTGVSFLGGTASMTRSIVYGCATGVQCAGGSALLGCNDFFLNGLNYDGCAAGLNDFYLDPKFCFWASTGNPYSLHSTSPCFVASANPCNVKIGAITSIIAGCYGTAVERSSWGAIKGMYR